MFDFALFFLVFLPLMDGIRQLRKMQKVKKLLLTGIVTSFIGTYFIYQSILAGKSLLLHSHALINRLEMSKKL